MVNVTYRRHEYISYLLLSVPVQRPREKGRVEELVVMSNVSNGTEEELHLLLVKDGGGALSQFTKGLHVYLQ